MMLAVSFWMDTIVLLKYPSVHSFDYVEITHPMLCSVFASFVSGCSSLPFLSPRVNFTAGVRLYLLDVA